MGSGKLTNTAVESATDSTAQRLKQLQVIGLLRTNEVIGSDC